MNVVLLSGTVTPHVLVYWLTYPRNRSIVSIATDTGNAMVPDPGETELLTPCSHDNSDMFHQLCAIYHLTGKLALSLFCKLAAHIITNPGSCICF